MLDLHGLFWMPHAPTPPARPLSSIPLASLFGSVTPSKSPSSPSLLRYDWLLGLPSPSSPVTTSQQWIAVRQRFEQFHRNLRLTPAQQEDGLTKCRGVVSCLNRHYYAVPSQIDNSLLIGSWGKNTATRPPRDVDVYFVLPATVYIRFQNHWWNRQSALLQEVKDVLRGTYPNTDMRADGQVVVVRFDSFSVEVVPAFLLTTGRYWICNTHDGGSYKETDPQAESNYINGIDTTNSQNLRPLIRMLKAWQAYNSVPMKSFQLELLAASFLTQSAWRQKDFFWFDWLIRDFFAYLCHNINSTIIVPGTLENIYLGDAWKSRAESAYSRALKACDYERDNRVENAGEEWRKIFGIEIPQRP